MKIPTMKAVIGAALALGTGACYLVLPSAWFLDGSRNAAVSRALYAVLLGIVFSTIVTVALYLLQPEGLERLIQTELDQENQRAGLPQVAPSTRHTPETRWLERVLAGHAALFFLVILLGRFIGAAFRAH